VRKIILDVDTGTDDATAIILAALSKDIDLIGVTTVWGNREIDITTKHTLMVTELIDRDIPVYKGCSGPMVRHLYRDLPPEKAELPEPFDEKGPVAYHGDFNLPEPKRVAEDIDAVTYLIKTLRTTKEKITLVPVGPLTNIALALIIAPDIVENIEEIVIMGGGMTQSNATTVGESNIVNDPEAAQIVNLANVKKTWVTLDATHTASLPAEYIEFCKNLHTTIGDFFADMLVERIRVYNKMQPLFVKDIAPIHDALCIAYLIDPSVLDDLRHVHLDICLDRGPGIGAFLIDNRHFSLKPNAYVAYSGDRDKFGQIVMDVLKNSQ